MKCDVGFVFFAEVLKEEVGVGVSTKGTAVLSECKASMCEKCVEVGGFEIVDWVIGWDRS